MLTEEQKKKLRASPSYQSVISGISKEYEPVEATADNVEDEIRNLRATRTKRPQEEEGVKGLAGVAVGAGKGVVSTLKGASSLGEKMIKGIGRFITPKGLEDDLGFAKTDKTAAEELIPEEWTEAKGTAEKIGKGIEQIGELFIPVPGLAAVGKVAKGTKLLSKAGLAGSGKFIIKEGVETAGKTALQTGDFKEAGKAGLAGLAGGVVGKFALEPALKIIPDALAKYLEKENLRLTPTQKTNLDKKLPAILDWLTSKKIVGTPEARFDKVDEIYNATEDTLQSFLKTSKKTVNKQKFLEELNGLKLKYQNERDVLAIEKQIDDVIETISKKYPEEIPVGQLNDFKRSTYRNAYNQAGNKVLDTVEHDLGDISRIKIENATAGDMINEKAIGAFNKEYGNIIDARKLLKIAQGRKQIGLMGKLITTGIGGTIGNAIGGPVGGAIGLAVGSPVAEGLAGTFTRSLLEKGLIDLSNVPSQQVEQAVLRAVLPYLRENSKQ
jgi:hypothetical protein